MLTTKNFISGKIILWNSGEVNTFPDKKLTSFTAWHELQNDDGSSSNFFQVKLNLQNIIM